MTLALIGPCMLLAPLVVLLVPVALVLWPVVLAALGAAWLVTLPVAVALWVADGSPPHWHAVLGRWFTYTLRPWQYFEPPRAAAEGGG